MRYLLPQVLALLFPFLASAQWISSDQCFRKKITISSSNVGGTANLNDFPILVSVTDGDLATTANGGGVESTSGFDIVFTKADGTTQLNHETVRYTAGTGEYIAWVKLDTLFYNTNTELYIYYGKSGTTDPSSTSTWNSGYQAVLHLQESGNGTDNEFKDATSNAYDGTGGGIAGAGSSGATPNQTTGKFGYAQDFTGGNNDRIRLKAIPDATWTAVTVQAWINPDDTGDDRIFGKCWGTGGGDQTWLLRQTGGSIGTRMRTNTNTNTGFDHNALTTANWQHVAVTWDASDNQLRVYLDGVEQGSTALAGATLYTTPTTDLPTIGNIPGGGRDYDGQIQEARVSDVARSAGWLLTEYNNQNNPSSFMSFGSAEGGVAGTVTATNTSVLSGNSTTVTITGNESGSTMQWQSSTDGTTFSNIGGATDTVLNTGALTQTTWFRATVTGSVCTGNSTALQIIVDPSFGLSNYCYRKRIAVDESQVCGSTNLTDFPMLVNFTQDLNLRTTANGGNATNANGWDIAFTSSDGSTQLSHQIEKYDGNTGEYIAWVKVPTLSASSSTILYMYYGNTSVAADPSTDNTWDSNYMAVYHLHDDFNDGTSNNNDGTNSGTTDVTGRIGDGQDFDGVNDQITAPNSASLDITGNQITLEAWARPQTPNDDDSPFLTKSNAINSEQYMLGIDGGATAGNVNSRVTTGDGHFRDDSGEIPNNQWSHVVFVYDGTLGSNPRKSVYVNGSLLATHNASGSMTSTTSDLRMGKRADNRWFEGRLDELRISNNARTADWVCTEYANQNSPSTFYSVGDEDGTFEGGTATAADNSVISGANTAVTLSGHTTSGTSVQWQSSTNNSTFSNIAGGTATVLGTGAITQTTFYRAAVSDGSCTIYSNTEEVEVAPDFIGEYAFRKKISIDGSQVCGSNDHTNFPFLISFTDNDLRTTGNSGNVTNANGFDIIFAASDGVTQLDHQLESYTATTGAVVAWVRIPTLFAAANTVIYVYYGNCTVSADQSTDATWNSDYAGVWHMDQDPSGSAPQLTDGTANNNDGTATGTMVTGDLITGKIAQAINFDGTDDRFDIPDDNSLDLTGDITISGWVNFDAQDANSDGLFSKKSTGANDYGLFFTADGSAPTATVRINAGEDDAGIQPTITNGTWYHYVGVFDNTNDEMRFYWDGVQLGSVVTVTETPAANTSAATIGSEGTDDNFTGSLDEVRVVGTALSEAWICTEYNNQNNPTATISLGSQEGQVGWTGATDTDWGTGSNWSTCVVPASGENIRIPDVSGASGNFPILDVNRTVGYLIIENNASVTLGSNTLTLNDDLSITGSLSGASGGLTFGGSNKQTVNSSSSLTLNNLEVNNTTSDSAVVLKTPVTISNQLNLLDGIVHNGTTNLITLNAGSSVPNCGTGSFVDGSLKKIGNTAFIFPTGDQGRVGKIGISAPANANAEFQAIYYTSAHPNFGDREAGLALVSQKEYWDLTRPVGSTGDSVRVTLYAEDFAYSEITSIGDLVVGHYEAALWRNEGLSGFTANSITSNNFITSFSPFTFADNDNGANPLPVEMLWFDGEVDLNQDGRLFWRTATEINSAYFLLEKTRDGETYSEVGMRVAQGESNAPFDYELMDYELEEGTTYYRLTAIDRDGSREVFDELALTRNTSPTHPSLSVHPNPAGNGQLVTIRWNGSESTDTPVQLRITDLGGRILMDQTIPAGAPTQLNPEAHGLSGGTYIVEIESDGQSQRAKLVVN